MRGVVRSLGLVRAIDRLLVLVIRRSALVMSLWVPVMSLLVQLTRQVVASKHRNRHLQGSLRDCCCS